MSNTYKWIETKRGGKVYYHLERDGEAITQKHRTYFACHNELKKKKGQKNARS